tara:strand:- start:76 stop:435 length:360 start_codon:yes stop_codon:yes gene_type:complete
MTKKKTKYIVYNDSDHEFALSMEALVWLAERGIVSAYQIVEEIKLHNSKNIKIDNTMIGLERHSALLALCIEELGTKRASAQGSMIRVRKISGNRYLIKRIGAIETVLTPEELVWIEVD